MQKVKHIVRTCVFYALVFITISGYSLTVLAEEASPPIYTYDPTTDHWNTGAWVFDTDSGTYKPKPQPATPTENTSVPDQTLLPVTDKPSTSTLDTATNTVNNTVNLENNSTSAAHSGDAGVTGNTSAGNATSGNVTASTTVVNTVHSTVQGDTVGVAHFTSDIYGNVTGDITLSPTIDSLSTQPTDKGTTTVNNVAVVTNNVAVNAGSGDATVSHNTTAGNATTGNTNAVVNVINLINSIIAANKSFIGTINIYGNLNGDILISPEFIPELLASNADSTSGSVASEEDQSIVNNVHLSASSGSADVSNNTTAGNATTGTAETNLTILNLTGHAVTASNSLLVFVNVLGTWVGVIVDAPGSTAAMLGSGVTNNASSNQAVSSTNKSQITNTIDVTASSGDASVTDNTKAGNATSGNATASANILNIEAGNISLSDWFGILFINVFGSWNGSFGVDTPSGSPPPVTTSPPSASTGAQAPAIAFGFVQHDPSAQQSIPVSEVASDSSDDLSVLGASDKNTTPINLTPTLTKTKPSFDLFMIIPAAILLLGTIATLLGRRHNRIMFAAADT
jgi:hypothetical protein